jgi:hypothetical protein
VTALRVELQSLPANLTVIRVFCGFTTGEWKNTMYINIQKTENKRIDAMKV